jgi:hypothetical protein
LENQLTKNNLECSRFQAVFDARFKPITQVVGSVMPHHTWDKALQVGPMDHTLTPTTIVLKHQHMYRVDDIVTILLCPFCCCAFWEHL